MAPPVINQAGPFCLVRHTNGNAHIDINKAGMEEFKEIFQRAFNTWQDPSPYAQELRDLILHGKVLQNYHR